MEAACKKSGRNPDDVQLLLATKTVDVGKIKQALALGETFIGENKVQELKQKAPDLINIAEEIHFIGHLQSNKVKEVIKWATCIQSIDRFSVAKELEKRLSRIEKVIDVFIQVNTSQEDSKFGVAPEDALALIEKVGKLPHLNVTGLMTIGLFSAESDRVRACFQILKRIQQEAISSKVVGPGFKHLSMGMSGDLEIAIEEGATIIRVGTAIFGERIYPDSYYWDEGL